MGSIAEVQPFDFIVVGGKYSLSPPHHHASSDKLKVELLETL